MIPSNLFGKIVRGVLFVATACGILGHASRASAVCQGTTAHQCWATLSGPNYSQVAVGKTPGGAGIACAVVAPQPSAYGGTLHCFAALGSSGGSLRGRGGLEARDPLFDAANPSRRIHSLAISPGPNSNEVRIWVLRSDSNVFVARTVWPIAEGSDPSILFQAAAPLAPQKTNLRSVAFASQFATLWSDSLNQQWTVSGPAWNLISTGRPLIAGNQTGSGQSLALVGSSGTSQTITGVRPGTFPPNLPAALVGGAGGFFALGRTTPLAVGTNDAWAVFAQGAPFCSGLIPCIARSTRGGFDTWSGWQRYTAGSSLEIQNVMSVQDGASMRGVRGEVWVISEGFRLLFFAP